jgi:hypothetical protein
VNNEVSGGVSDEEAAWRDLVAHYSMPPEADSPTGPWPAREDLPEPGAASPSAGPAGGLPASGPGPGAPGLAGPAGEGPPMTSPPPAASVDPVPGVIPAPPQMRIIRPAVPFPLPLPGGEDAGDDRDDHYVPPDPPPLPRLDSVSKAAWAALFGGPGYLLVAVSLGWAIPGWGAFCAVAAFVGGFTTLVVRLGDRPPRDSGPDDGAVV